MSSRSFYAWVWQASTVLPCLQVSAATFTMLVWDSEVRSAGSSYLALWGFGRGSVRVPHRTEVASCPTMPLSVATLWSSEGAVCATAREPRRELPAAPNFTKE